MFKVGWWFNICYYNNLNGVYWKVLKMDVKEVLWYYWGNMWKFLKFVKMMICLW